MKKVLGIVALMALAVAIWVAAVDVNNTPDMPGLKVGDTAPDFKLKNVDGKMVSLKDYNDAKGYIVIFTCNTCPVAKAYENRIIELHNKTAPKGYPVVAIQPNDPSVQPGDSFEAMQARAKAESYPFAYLFDDGQKIYPQYGASRTPEVYLLDKNLKLRYTGAIDDNQNSSAVTVNYVEKAIAAIEAGKEPDPSLVKAVGCGIKAKKNY
ncbi:MAG: thioredoxin family protein [Saprospiraceae bacterium]|nr:thioredoxin family protein [Saprospiraceae bacterium]